MSNRLSERVQHVLLKRYEKRLKLGALPDKHAMEVIDQEAEKFLFSRSTHRDLVPSHVESLSDWVRYYSSWQKNVYNESINRDVIAENFCNEISAYGYDANTSINMLILDSRLNDVINCYGTDKSPAEMFSENKTCRRLLFEKDKALREDLANLYLVGNFVPSGVVTEYLNDRTLYNDLAGEFESELLSEGAKRRLPDTPTDNTSDLSEQYT